MLECDDQDYDSFFNDFEIKRESENEWIFSNTNSLSQSILSSDYELNSIVTNDSLSAEFNISNETFLLSPSLSDITTNESGKFSLFEQIPITLYDSQQNQSEEIHELLSINSNDDFIRNLKNDFGSETKFDIHSEKSLGVNNVEINDTKYQGSIFDENINIEPNLSYVIIDKASFVNLLEKSQLSHNDAVCNYSLSQLLSVNSTPTIIPITNMKYNLISNPFHNLIESKRIEDDFSFKKLNDLAITGTQLLIQDNLNNERDVPIFIGTENIFDNVVTYRQPQSNYANYNSFNILNNTINLNPTEITHSIKTEICTTNLPSNLSQLSSTSSQCNGEYKVETMIISDNEETNDDQLCLVCGDLASCQHYGVKSCEGCKGFFKRTIQKNASPTYVCLHSQNCVIDKQNRNRCQFCRYVKCIKVGMVKEIVRKESLKGRRGRLSSKVKMKNSGAQSLYTVVNLLSTIKTAVEISEPKGLEKLTLKEFHSIERFQRKIKSEDILSYVTNELHESLKVVKQFAEKLIGFNTLSKRDQTLILVLNGLEFITLRAALRLFSDYLTTSKTLQESTRGSIILDNGCILTKSFLTRSIFSSWSNQTQELSAQLEFLHKNDKEIVNGILAVTLLKIEIDSEESKQLEDASLVYSLRHRYIEVLKTYCNSKMLLDTKISPNSKTTKKSVSQASKQLKQNSHISDPKFLSKLLDKQINVQSIVKSHLLKPLIKQYFNTDNINDCDKIFKNLLSGQEIISFCPKWLFKLIAYKTMPHLCTQQL